MSAPVKRPSIPASVVRGACQKLVRAARKQAPLLQARIIELAGPEAQVADPEVASMNGLRRDILGRLEVDAWLMPSPEQLSALATGAIDLTVLFDSEGFEEASGALASAIEEDEALRLLNTQDWRDWPTYAGIDLLVCLAGADSVQAPRMRLRLQTAESLEAIDEMRDLYDSIRGLRPRAERVTEDFVGASDLEIFFFLDLHPEIGHAFDSPAGLFCLMTNENAQVGCHWDSRGWKPSAEVEHLVVTADPCLLPIDLETAEALGAFSPVSGLR